MSGVNLRPATLVDLPALCALRIEFLAEGRDVRPEALSDRMADTTRQFFERTMSSGVIESWLIEHEGSAIGLASVVMHDVPPLPEDPRSHEGYVINMYVCPDFRGQGLGRRLLDACLGVAGERGIRRFYLYATESGRPMYESAGFANHKNWMVVQVPQT
jgi:GNAT superfamily N-acetyltransferase